MPSYSQGFRYFDDNVRDDYAAGQLDAQVSLQGHLFASHS